MTAESDKRSTMTDEEYDQLTKDLIQSYRANAEMLRQDPSPENIQIAIQAILHLSEMVSQLHRSMEKIRKLHKVT